MIEAIAMDLIRPPAPLVQLFQQDDTVTEVRKRGRRSGRSNRRQNAPVYRPTRNQALFIGAIILMSNGDGTEYPCQITHQDASGVWICEPVQGE